MIHLVRKVSWSLRLSWLVNFTTSCVYLRARARVCIVRGRGRENARFDLSLQLREIKRNKCNSSAHSRLFNNIFLLLFFFLYLGFNNNAIWEYIACMSCVLVFVYACVCACVGRVRAWIASLLCFLPLYPLPKRVPRERKREERRGRERERERARAR